MSFQHNLCDLRVLGGEYATAIRARRTRLTRAGRTSTRCSRPDPATRIMARSVPVDPERTVLGAGMGTALTAPRKVSRLQLTAGGLKVIWQSAGRRA